MMQNKYPVLEPAQNNNYTEEESNFNLNRSMVSVQDQANEDFFDISNIPIILSDDFAADISENNLENYVPILPIESFKLNGMTREITFNTSFNTQRPILQDKLADYSSSSESENNEKSS